VVGRIRFALERWDSPRHRSHVAQLVSLGHEAVFGFGSLVWLAMIWVVRFCDAATSDSSIGTRLALGGAN
jgi:hypothetical protein